MQKYDFSGLKGKICALTGGGGVIGMAMARAFAAAGIKMAILDLKKDIAEKAAKEIEKETGTRAAGIEANVLDETSLEKASAEIKQQLGPVDILVNCAGGNSPKATTQIEIMKEADKKTPEKTFYGLALDGFKFVFDLNFMGTLLPSMILTKDMLQSGSGVILNISSMNSFKPLTKIPAYSAAKAAVNNFTEWLATHLAQVNIRVNAIAPGFFLTNQNRFLLTDEKTGGLTERGKKIINGTPMGKFGEPEDLCGTALFLVSDLSSFLTGVVIPVDGGFNAYSGV
ncbi:MAG: D-mannonate oxidoreductase [Spirochaetes bacterium GWF1_41_5]|nr:MAG: D-mannonate oxidoreductase [Spirochaetes bacterium GWF1_41_5]HBE02064.1 D-mannonate oxidoreductase [Spirochaetia bacterium]